ncbi:glutathione S-transferase [Rhizophagus irregularis]|uniref:Glutathione S-transferase n=1 Tax=Rhizophagus irregularis TaxID=588596 RepID=A0A2N0QR97_9GLOM|nr:glutathione S-transferase [Rhizophagus irregularis]
MTTSPDITLYTTGGQNGGKPSIILEELGIPYKVKNIELRKNEQFEPWFLKINPNGKIPAIVDHSKDDFPVFESTAIAIYLCENYDTEEKLLPKNDPKLRSQVIQWVMFEASGIAPTQGQSNFYCRYLPEKIPFAINNCAKEIKRLYDVMNKSLEGKEYLVGNKFTLADAMSYPMIRGHFFSGIESIDEFPNLKAWVERIDTRPATQKGLNVPVPDKMKEYRENPEKLEEFEKLIQSFFKEKQT